MKYHKTALLKETIEKLNIKPTGIYVDCTLGEAGHSLEILKRLTTGKLISLDRDEEAIEFVKKEYKNELEKNKNWTIKKANFKNIDKILVEIGVTSVDGIVMDLGLSSRQLEASERGFSYLEGSQDLDMRMDQELNVKAIDLLKFYDEKRLGKIIWEFGEEKNARRIAKHIKKEINKIQTVEDLNQVILRAVPAANRDTFKHPSRRVFQALRIAVNDELENLRDGLEKSFDVLKKNGLLVVISFHSLEDRIVKRFFKSKTEQKAELILPSEEEINLNPRARSAKLRYLIKLKDK